MWFSPIWGETWQSHVASDTAEPSPWQRLWNLPRPAVSVLCKGLLGPPRGKGCRCQTPSPPCSPALWETVSPSVHSTPGEKGDVTSLLKMTLVSWADLKLPSSETILTFLGPRLVWHSWDLINPVTQISPLRFYTKREEEKRKRRDLGEPSQRD